jgi:hypothetical protein
LAYCLDKRSRWTHYWIKPRLSGRVIVIIAERHSSFCFYISSIPIIFSALDVGRYSYRANPRSNTYLVLLTIRINFFIVLPSPWLCFIFSQPSNLFLKDVILIRHFTSCPSWTVVSPVLFVSVLLLHILSLASVFEVALLDVSIKPLFLVNQSFITLAFSCLGNLTS